MEAKVINLPLRKNKPVLTRLMIIALIDAHTMQNNGITFGPVDIRGASFSGLIKRELVVYETLTVKNISKSKWRVTQKGINILKTMGIDVDSH